MPIKGYKQSDSHKEKLSKIAKGRHFSERTRIKLSKSHKGKNSYNWKGGITQEHKTIRRSVEYRLWREAVFERDNWTCQKCKIRSGKLLHPHHILNFAEYPEVRFAIDNGITLHESCHRKFHKLYGRTDNTKEQIIDYLTLENLPI